MLERVGQTTQIWLNEEKFERVDSCLVNSMCCVALRCVACEMCNSNERPPKIPIAGSIFVPLRQKNNSNNNNKNRNHNALHLFTVCLYLLTNPSRTRKTHSIYFFFLIFFFSLLKVSIFCYFFFVSFHSFLFTFSLVDMCIRMCVKESIEFLDNEQHMLPVIY